MCFIWINAWHGGYIFNRQRNKGPRPNDEVSLFQPPLWSYYFLYISGKSIYKVLFIELKNLYITYFCLSVKDLSCGFRKVYVGVHISIWSAMEPYSFGRLLKQSIWSAMEPYSFGRLLKHSIWSAIEPYLFGRLLKHSIWSAVEPYSLGRLLKQFSIICFCLCYAWMNL